MKKQCKDCNLNLHTETRQWKKDNEKKLNERMNKNDTFLLNFINTYVEWNKKGNDICMKRRKNTEVCMYSLYIYYYYDYIL